MKLDVVNNLDHRTNCKSRYNTNGRKANNNTSRHNQETKVLMTITIELSSDETQPGSLRT